MLPARPWHLLVDSNQLPAAWAGAPDSTTAACTGSDLDGTVVARKSLQPSLQVYDLFDDILLLSEGHTVFHGPREEVRSLPVPTCVGAQSAAEKLSPMILGCDFRAPRACIHASIGTGVGIIYAAVLPRALAAPKLILDHT